MTIFEWIAYFYFSFRLYKMHMHKTSCKGDCDVLPAHQCPKCHDDCMGFWSVPLVMRRGMAIHICFLFPPIATYLLYFRRKVTAASMVWNESVALPAGRSIRSSWNEWNRFSVICANHGYLAPKELSPASYLDSSWNHFAKTMKFSFGHTSGQVPNDKSWRLSSNYCRIGYRGWWRDIFWRPICSMSSSFDG